LNKIFIDSLNETSFLYININKNIINIQRKYIQND